MSFPALREAIRRLDGPTDPDQVEAFRWVRDTSSEARIYIGRYVREDDRADPCNWPDLLHRINSFAERIEQRLTEDQKRRRTVQKLRHQLEQAVAEDDDGLWQPVARTLDELVADGVPQSEDLSNHHAYLDHWLGHLERDPRYIFAACTAASKAADFVLSFSREHEPVEEPVLA